MDGVDVVRVDRWRRARWDFRFMCVCKWIFLKREKSRQRVLLCAFVVSSRGLDSRLCSFTT